MTTHSIKHILDFTPTPDSLWTHNHKIPWNDPAFSARMLNEHLSQTHDLASRKLDTIEKQARWIHETLLGKPASVLDLCCGPGLYAPHLVARGHVYHGIDFGPASIKYAQQHFSKPGQCTFTLSDVVCAAYEGPADLVMLLYGELNVFSPQNVAAILRKAYDALSPGGRILLEPHTYDAVRQSGHGTSWYKTDGGLFSEKPHICLTENFWFEEESVAQQLFHVIEAQSGRVSLYRSTMQAWTDAQYTTLLQEAGFTNITTHEDWPAPGAALQLMSAQK